MPGTVTFCFCLARMKVHFTLSVQDNNGLSSLEATQPHTTEYG